jgi:hypothetical protein
MPEDKVKNSLTRIYERFDADMAQRRSPGPVKRSPILPLSVLIIFLIVTVIFEERARYLAEIECNELRAKIAETEAQTRTTEETKEPPPLKKEVPGVVGERKRTVKAKKRQSTEQKQLYSGGEGAAGTVRN